MAAETAPQVIIDDDVSLLLYHPRTKIVHHQLRTAVQGERFRALLEKGLELFISGQGRNGVGIHRA